MKKKLSPEDYVKTLSGGARIIAEAMVKEGLKPHRYKDYVIVHGAHIVEYRTTYTEATVPGAAARLREGKMNLLHKSKLEGVAVGPVCARLWDPKRRKRNYFK